MIKIITWIGLNGASVLGMIQALLKCLKEVITAVINLLSLLAPTSKAKEFVLTVRAWIEKIDAVVEKIKVNLIS